MKLNKTVLMGLIALATLSFSACGDSKKTDAAATSESSAAPAAAAPATSGPVIRVLDGNGAPITKSVTIVITCPQNNIIKLKTAEDGTVALPTDQVTYPASFTAEGEGHTYNRRQISNASDIFGNKVVILQN